MKFYITDQTRVEIENRIRSINKNMHDMAMITFGIDIDKSIGEKDRKELEMLEEILSNSAPIIPEIEKAMNAAREIQDDSAHDTFTAEDISGCTEVCTYGWRYKTTNKDYISNLKLDI